MCFSGVWQYKNNEFISCCVLLFSAVFCSFGNDTETAIHCALPPQKLECYDSCRYSFQGSLETLRDWLETVYFEQCEEDQAAGIKERYRFLKMIHEWPIQEQSAVEGVQARTTYVYLPNPETVPFSLHYCSFLQHQAQLLFIENVLVSLPSTTAPSSNTDAHVRTCPLACRH